MPLSHAGSIGPLPSCFNFGLKIHIMNDDLRDLTHYQHVENVERAAEDTVVNAQCSAVMLLSENCSIFWQTCFLTFLLLFVQNYALAL